MKNISALLILLIVYSCNYSNGENTRHISNADASETSVDTLALINQQIMNNPGDKELYLTKADYFLRHGQLKNAMNEVDRAIVLDSNNASYYVKKAKAYFDFKQVIDARIWAEKALEKDPENVDANTLLGWVFLIGKNYDACFKHLNDALKTDPFHAEAYFVKGMAYKEQGDFKRAVSNFRTATEQDNDYYEAWLQLGILYDYAGDSLASAFYENALRIDSNSIEALYDYGLHLQNQKNYDYAIRAYEHILRINPGFQDAIYNMGYIYLEGKRNYDSASYFFDKVINLNPYHYKAYYNRGLAYEHKGRNDLALKDYNKSLEIKPDFELAARGKSRLVD